MALTDIIPGLDAAASSVIRTGSPLPFPSMVDPSTIQPQEQQVPAQAPDSAIPGAAPHRGILDALFPTDAYKGLIDPAALKKLQGQALMRAGLRLMAAGGPRPQGTRNIGADIAGAIEGGQGSVDQGAQKQLGMDQLRIQRQQMSDLRDLGKHVPFPQDGDFRAVKDWAAKASAYALSIGRPDLIEHIGGFLRGMSAGETGANAQNKFATFKLDSKTHKWVGVREDGTEVPTNISGDKDPNEEWSKLSLLSQRANRQFMDETKTERQLLTFASQGLNPETINSAIQQRDMPSMYAVLHAFAKTQDPNIGVRPGTVQVLKHARSALNLGESEFQKWFQNESGLITPTEVRQIATVLRRETFKAESSVRRAYGRATSQLPPGAAAQGFGPSEPEWVFKTGYKFRDNPDDLTEGLTGTRSVDVLDEK